MKNGESNIHESASKSGYEHVKDFRELFALLESNKPSTHYADAYEEAAQLAKGLVVTKSKSSWDSSDFAIRFGEKYPEISSDFIAALQRCIEGYNPIVNIPTEPLWE